MRTRNYVLLFISASLLVVAGALLKIEKHEYASFVLGAGMSIQALVIISFVVRTVNKKS